MRLKFLPGLHQFNDYSLLHLSNDLTSGIIVACLLIPQSMAYAVIAGVPVVYGLISAVFPPLVYSFFGSSRYLSVGPVSIVSLLAFSSVSFAAQDQSLSFLTLIMMLTLIVGCIQLLLGMIKFGTFFNAVSPAVISGFTTASAIIIASTQVEALTGIPINSAGHITEDILEIIHHMSYSHPWTAGIGLGSLGLLLLVKYLFRASLGPLMVMVISSLAVRYFHLDQNGVDIIGHIPQTWPAFSLQIPSMSALLSLLPSAFMIAFMSFAESFAVSRTLAANDREMLNPNQELAGLGLANLISSITSAIPVAGGISRTAINYQAGAKSNLSSLFTATFVLLALLYFTPFLYYLPTSALAAIIILAVSNLIDINSFRFYLKNDLNAAFLMITTFALTLMIDVVMGLIVGISLSLLVTFIRKKVWFLV